MIDQNIAAADDGTDTACKVFRTDRQVDAGGIFQRRTLFLIGRIEIDRHLFSVCEYDRIVNTAEQKIIVFCGFHIIIYQGVCLLKDLVF